MSLAPARVDWRWALASDATEYTQTQALARLAGADPIVLDGYRFKRAADAGRPTDKWPAVESAYELKTNRPAERLFIEGMLLADADYAYIATMAGCSPDDVRAYHDLFFDVKTRLQSSAWVVGNLFQGALYQTMNVRDRIAQMHRLAWLGGVAVFEAYYTGRYDDEIRQKVVHSIRDIMAKKTLLMVGCTEGGDETKLDMIRIFIDDTNKVVREVLGGPGAEKEYGAAVMSFLSSVSMQVVNPADPANLTLPAREPRAAEYTVQVGTTDDSKAHA